MGRRQGNPAKSRREKHALKMIPIAQFVLTSLVSSLNKTPNSFEQENTQMKLEQNISLATKAPSTQPQDMLASLAAQRQAYVSPSDLFTVKRDNKNPP
jgi:hypothetical protein